MNSSTIVETGVLAAALLLLQAGILFLGVARPLAAALREGTSHRPAFEESIEVRGARLPRGF